jgi:hypothetical protein
MADQALTDERWAELSALLNDEQRLNAEYPKVADYLDTGLRLQGTGDAGVDGSFDIRLVHYMVGGNADTVNPYWDIVAPLVNERDGRRVANGGKPDGSARLAYGQMVLQAVYAYAIPSPETLQWVTEFCVGRPVLELGAGRGYWAAQLARSGLKVAAYDSEPPDAAENASFPPATGQRDVWHPVDAVRDLAEPIADHPDSVLFLCWPPGWGSSMGVEALTEFARAGGDRLIFLGQPRGGMNATDAFFDLLADEWRLESEDVRHVSWWNAPDVAQGWVRR